MKKIKIKLVKSVIGTQKKHKQTVFALGLKRINQVVEKRDTEAIQGMIRKVSHLVKVI